MLPSIHGAQTTQFKYTPITLQPLSREVHRLPSKGVKSSILLYSNSTPIVSLREAALGTLSEELLSRDHHISQDMYEAIEEVYLVLENMAQGKCGKQYFLSSLDPGVGKTTAVIHFLRALQTTKSYQDKGAMVCVSTLEEVTRLAKELKNKGVPVGVITSDEKVNGLGSSAPEWSQVIITTQQMLERTAQGAPLKNLDKFLFKGSVRSIRIWDESMLPKLSLVATRDDLGKLTGYFRDTANKLAECLDELLRNLHLIKESRDLTIPKVTDCGLQFSEAIALMSEAPDADKECLEKLWGMSGDSVRVRVDKGGHVSLIANKCMLPSDMAPVLILDASGRVRHTYNLWEQDGALVRLKTAPKRYSNLQVKVWSQGGGKTTLREKKGTILEGIAEVINKHPHQEVLIVHHKSGLGYDFPRALKRFVKGDKRRVKFLNWGKHHGTNDFRDVERVILAGTQFFRPEDYEALARAAGAYEPTEEVPKSVLEDVMLGEQLHGILQALCRAQVRYMENGDCPTCEAYLIASPRHGVRGQLHKLFPGCKVADWRPAVLVEDIQGRVAEAFEYILRELQVDPNRAVPIAEVMKTLGVKDRSNFRKNVRQNPSFIHALNHHGIQEVELDGKSRGYGYNS